MKQKPYYFLLYLFLLLKLSSCSNLFDFGVELKERAHFYKDGSGKFKLTFDLSKMRKFLALVTYIDQNYHEITRPISHSFIATQERIKRIPGISKATIVQDKQRLHFTLAFHFKDIESLNRVMHTIYQHIDPPHLNYFQMSEHVFIRTDNKSIASQLAYYKKHDTSLVKSFDLDLFFNAMRYTTIYSFEKSLKKITNPYTSIAKHRKRLETSYLILAKKEQHVSMSNHVFF